MTSTLPLSSLRLFIPPLRLMTAAMWQVAQQQSIKHYMMLDDFVSLVTEAVPQLLTKRQRSLLLLALRTKVTLCDTDPLAAHAHLNKLHLVSEQPDEEGDERWVALLALSNKLTESPVDRHLLLQEVFNQTFDFALQSLISDFLYRIEQLFPVPDFRQAASWLDAAPRGLEDYLPEVDKKDLRELLTNHCCLQGQATALVGQDTEKILLSAWSHPLFTKLANPDAPATESEIQSDPLPCVVTPIHEGVEMVKVEMVVMTEEEQEEVDETVIGQTMSPVEHEVSTDSSAVGIEEHAVTVDADSLKDSQGNAAVQSEGPVSQSHQSCSEDTSNPLHTISHISQRVAHKCPQCGKCFVYRSQVIRHLRTNKSCGSLSAKSGTVSLQLQPDHEEEPRPPESCLREPRPCKTHTCFQCATGFETKADLLLHQRSHRTRIIYQCDQCDKEFHHLSSLSNHKQTHLERGKFTCSQSDRVIELVKKRDALRLQRRVATLTCTVCDKTFSAQTPLLRHLQTHSAEGAEPCYNCHFCDQTFSGVTQLRIHQRTHKFRTYQCDQCSKTYSSLTGLNSHRARHTNECRYLCPQCGKRFKTRDGLEGHLRTHTGERPYRCPYCPKDFTAVAGLNVHVRRHTGERPYVCTVCSKAWPSGGDLQKHMRTHTGERPYVCQECGKAFSISCHLTEHRRIHTGEKPYACPECGKCLRRKFDLKKHVLAHSKVRPYTCSYCPKSYTRKTHLSRHLQTHGAADGEAAAEMADEV